MTALNVVQFKPREAPTISGKAKCIGCSHEWVAVAPVGTWQLECPSCGTEKGIYKFPVGPVEGDLSFVCLCGCEALTAYQRKGRFYLRCMVCGTDQTDAVFG